MDLNSKIDSVINAVTVGMTPEDAYIFAGLTTQEIALLEGDEDLQRRLKQCSRALEHHLLMQMSDIANKQVRMGKEGATAWLLEKLFPRYSSKPQESAVPVTINLGQQDPASLDTVTIMNPAESEQLLQNAPPHPADIDLTVEESDG